MSTKIKWFNTADVVPENDCEVIGFDGNRNAIWWYRRDKPEGEKWYPPLDKYNNDPIFWAHIPEWTEEEVPSAPGLYNVFDKAGRRVINMFIPENTVSTETSRYFGNAMMANPMPWFDCAAHTFKKVENPT